MGTDPREGLRPRERRRSWLVTAREKLSSSLWFMPAVFVVLALALEQLTSFLDRNADPSLPLVDFVRDADVASSALTTIAASMLTLLGVVFSITIVAIQLASSQFSPRVLRTFLGDRVTQVTLASFVGTFVYALMALRRIDPDGGAEGGIAVFTAIVLVLGTLSVFIVFVHHTVHSIRAVNIIEAVTVDTRATIEALYPDEDGESGEQADLEALGLTDPVATVSYEGESKVLAGLDLGRLVALAATRDQCYVLNAQVGDFLPTGVPVASVFGGEPPSSAQLSRTFELSDERTVYQDAAFGLRQLVDIASRSLSSGINDPTTAGQAIDRLVDLLRRIGRRPEPSNVYRDDEGIVRVVTVRPNWDDLVTLAFTEIRMYGADSVQVTRRLAAALEDLRNTVADRAPGRLRALAEQRTLLEKAVDRAHADPDDRRLALATDRTGIG